MLKRNRVVLLGIGHTNAYVLRQWAMSPIRDAELVCISDHYTAAYSGMLPAVLAKQRPDTAMNLDLVRLTANASARLINSEVTSVDTENQLVAFRDRPALQFDLLSIGIGSTSTSFNAESPDQHVPIKPMQTFLERLDTRINRIVSQSPDKPVEVVIVGGGVASIEVALCLPNRLATIIPTAFKLTLITSNESVASELPIPAARRLATELNDRGITVLTNTRVARTTESSVSLSDQSSINADLIISSTGATPPTLLEDLPFPKDKQGFLLTEPTLQVVGFKNVYAVGDCGTLSHKPTPKAGVYAVRQGPVLWNNIQRSLKGMPNQPYRPQQKFLKLINLGNGQALAQRGSFHASGKWALRLKHHIDDKFMRMHAPVHMPMPTMDEPAIESQCRGCGCKLDAALLANAIQELNPGEPTKFEDSVVIQDDGVTQLTATSDFFSAPFQDDFLSGRVAALHSLSDLVASGSRPTSALSNVVLADGPPVRQQEQFIALTAGAERELASFGVKIAGGHTIVGPRTEIGLTVIGKRASETDVGKHQLDDGDHLYLTKPLGSGILMAAHMRAMCAANDYRRLISHMLQPLVPWLDIIESLSLRAVTDVTGFGLSGHLLEMLQASRKQATIGLSEIPFLSGVTDLSETGIQSTLAPANFKNERFIEAKTSTKEHPSYPVLFDPQTCGGFLIGIPKSRVQELHDQAARNGVSAPTFIGCVSERKQNAKLLNVKMTC